MQIIFYVDVVFLAAEGACFGVRIISNDEKLTTFAFFYANEESTCQVFCHQLTCYEYACDYAYLNVSLYMRRPDLLFSLVAFEKATRPPRA